MAISDQKKKNIYNNFRELCQKYDQYMTFDCSYVPALALGDTRKMLREAEIPVVFGKNTTLKCAIKDLKGYKYEKLRENLVGNVAVVFIEGSLAKVYDILTGVVTTPLPKAGVIARNNVVIPARVTNLNPGQTGFFQSLQIPTRVTKGNIEIVSDIELLKVGDMVSPNHAALMVVLNIRPFEYTLMPQTVILTNDTFPAEALALKVSDVEDEMKTLASEIVALSLATGQCNKASLPHACRKAFIDSKAIALACGLQE